METVELKKKILRLLREDEEFKLAVAGLLGYDTILNELKKLREDFQHFMREQERRWEENNRRWEEAYKRFEAIERKLLEHDKRFEAIERKLLEHDRRFNSLMRRITAIGARWGIHTETAFRRAVRGIIEEILGKGRVEKWVYFDEAGEVYGYPSQVEVDVLIKNGLHILVEVKASASIGDVSILWGKGKLYEKVTGVKPRLVIITPFIDKSARETAVKQGVEVYTRV
ncbi:MAG: DUF3782 domain-containing protein [Thermosphaera sp.]|nr:DUF3782 domain-containing protein [Thermosphaera sp.]